MAMATTSSSSFVNRMLRAAKLEVPLFEEVEADISATRQALLVVVLVAAAAGIGAAIGATMNANGANVAGRLLGGVLNALLGWAVWSYVVYFVGTRFMGGTASYGELLRTLGFANSPRVLLIFSFIPVVGGLLSLVVGIWALVASFIATRQALDIDNGKTFVTILLGFIALMIVGIVLGLIFGAGVLLGSAV